MKKFLTIALIVMIAVLGFACVSNAYSINMESNTKKEVTPEETFTLTIAMDEKTSLANGHINYDTKLFEFVSANQENMSAQAYIEEGYVSWMYTNTNSGIDSYTFSFKAKDVSKTSTGTFTLTDAVFIAESEETYEGETLKGTSKVDVTIKVEEKATADDKDDKVDSEDKKENATTTTDKESGKKDNTITSDTKLPQTGKGMLAYIVIALAILAIVLKVKHKKMNKLFSVLVIPVVATMLMATSVSALKLADTDNYQVGLFDSLIDGEKIVAVNPGKTFYTNTDLSLEMLQSIFSEENLTIDTIKDSEGNVLEDTSKIATGNKVVLTDESEYTVLLYGDANGDGTICNCIDVNVIREEYVYGDKASEVNRIAADLSPDNILNVKDVALIVKKYTNRIDEHLVIPFPDDDYELPKQKIQDEDVLKINSVDTTSNTATINIELDTTGLTANSITYEIYDAGNVLVKTHTVTELTTLAHTFEELEPEKEYFVIVTVDCDEANYYAEQTVTTKASTDEPDGPDEPINPDEPTDRVIEAELVISNVKAGSADMEIVLADGITLEDDDKIFFGHSAGSHGGQVQHDELSYQKTDLDANKEQTFWATIYDKDNNTLWFSEYQSVKTPAIEFDLTANKDEEDPKTKIIAQISNVNSDEFDFEKIQCKVEKIIFNDEGKPSAWNIVLDEEIKSLDTNIIFSQLTPGESYNVEVRIYDTAGNYAKKIVENIKMDSDTTTEPDQPDEPTEPEEPRELTAELEVVDLGEDSITVKINLSDELLDGETIKYAITPGPNGGETSGLITDTEYTFSGLGKNIPYSITAAVYNEDGTEICRTETITANIVEDNIEIAEMETTENSIKVRLSGAPNRVITENDKIIFKVMDTSNNVKATSIEYSIGEANGSGHTFTDLNPSTQYYVYAILQNENGITATSNTLNITTDKEEQPEEPDEPVIPDEPTTGYTATLNVDTTTVTTSSLLVQLTVTPELENYTVKYYANGTTSYESTSDTHTFENLKAGETYAFWAEVYNEDGEKVATTDMVTQLMPSPDINVYVEANSENSILVSAVPYYVETDTFTIEKYDMWISKINTEDSTYTDVKVISDVECIDGAFENYEIKGLEANTTYLVTVKGTDNGGNEVTKTATITTAEAPRQFEADLSLVSTSIDNQSGKGIANVELNVIKGTLQDTDIVKYEYTEIEGHPTGQGDATGKTHTYDNLKTNTIYKLIANIYDKNSSNIGYAELEVEIREVKITDFHIQGTQTDPNSLSTKLISTGTIDTDKFIYEIRKQGETSSLSYEGDAEGYIYAGLIQDQTYYLKAKIYDENWNLLAVSKEISPKTPTPKIALNLTNKKENPSTQVDIRVSIITTVSFGNDIVYDYYIYKVNEDLTDSEVKRKLDTDTPEWTATDLLPNTQYKVVVIAEASNGNTSTAEDTITTADAVDTIIVTMDNTPINDYDPRRDNTSPLQTFVGLENYSTEDLKNITVDGELRITISDSNDANDNIPTFSKINEDTTSTSTEFSLENSHKTLVANITNASLFGDLSNMPIYYNLPKGLEDGDTINFEIDTSNLTLSPREDITIEGQSTEVVVNYRVVDETPKIELNVTNETESDKATATIDVTNLAKIDKYYYKLYGYRYGYNGLYPVEGSDGSWVESDSNEYVFDDLAENTTYLVVAKAESIQGNYSDEKKYEFTTTSFKPKINVTATPAEEKPATQIQVTAEPTNEIAIKNYQFALIDNVHTTEDGKAIYIEMPVEEDSTNSYNFIGLYPNTKYTAFGQAESEKGVMSNYNNKSVKTEVIRDTLTIANQTTTDSIKVSVTPSNLLFSISEIQRTGIYDLNIDDCTIKYMYKEVDSEKEPTIAHEVHGQKNSDSYTHTYENLMSGKSYELWMEIYDKNGKLIWTTKQVKQDPTTGQEKEEGIEVELEALQIASIEANRRQEYSLDIRVKLDEESLERLGTNTYTYDYVVYKGSTEITRGTISKNSKDYSKIIDDDSINFETNNFYTKTVDEEYKGDIFQITGLEPDTNYTIEMIAVDKNGGKAAEATKQTIKTRAAVPEINVRFNYIQTKDVIDGMVQTQQYRIEEATVEVINDAVIDWEYFEKSGFNFKLYEAEIVNGEASKGEMIASKSQTRLYGYEDEEILKLETSLEKTLAREDIADEAIKGKYKQAYTYTTPINTETNAALEIDENYILEVSATSRVKKNSDIKSCSFVAEWKTPDLDITTTQPTATSAELDISNTNTDPDAKVEKYTITVVKATNIDRNSNGDIVDVEFEEGTSVDAKIFTSDDFIDSSTQSIEVDHIKELDIDCEYVVIIDAQAENGTTKTYYELIDTTAIARVSTMGNSSYYKTLQSAVDAAPRHSEVYLIKDTTESVTFNSVEREGIKLTSENNAKLTKIDLVQGGVSSTRYSVINVESEAGVILENIEIEGYIIVKNTKEKEPILNINDNVKVNSDNSTFALMVYNNSNVNISGTNISLTGNQYGINNVGSVKIENSENIEIKGNIGICNSSNISIKNATGEIAGRTGISNQESGTLNITNELSKLTISGDTTYGISNTHNATLKIKGKNIEITGESAGIFNGYNTETTCTISTIATENDGEAIKVGTKNKNGIVNSGKLTIECTEEGTFKELILSSLSNSGEGYLNDLTGLIKRGVLQIGNLEE